MITAPVSTVRYRVNRLTIAGFYRYAGDEELLAEDSIARKGLAQPFGNKPLNIAVSGGNEVEVAL